LGISVIRDLHASIAFASRKNAKRWFADLCYVFTLSKNIARKSVSIKIIHGNAV
jgi:hypothetical protein